MPLGGGSGEHIAKVRGNDNITIFELKDYLNKHTGFLAVHKYPSGQENRFIFDCEKGIDPKKTDGDGNIFTLKNFKTVGGEKCRVMTCMSCTDDFCNRKNCTTAKKSFKVSGWDRFETRQQVKLKDIDKKLLKTFFSK